MSRFSVDFDNLTASLNKRSFPLSEVKDRIEKVAFDMVKFKDGTIDELWRIESGSDGDYIVALYEEEEVKTSSPWRVMVKNSSLNVFYKDGFIGKIAAKDLGFEESDLELAKGYLPDRLAKNASLRKSFLSTLSEHEKKTIISKYPELA